MNTSIIPQANQPWHFVAVAVAADTGVRSAAEFAQALDMDPRQGSYYAAAAERLGLLDSVADHDGTTWSPTTLGRDLARVATHYTDQPDELASYLAGIIAADPLVDGLTDLDGDELDRAVAEMAELFELEGLAEVTATRRASTIAAWAGFVRSRTAEDAAAVTASVTHVRATAPAIVAARQAAAEERRRAEEAAQPQVCTGCYLQLPASGVCDECD